MNCLQKMSSLQTQQINAEKQSCKIAADMIITHQIAEEKNEKCQMADSQCQTADSPGSRDDDTPGKARAQVPQVPADDQKSPTDHSDQSTLTNIH